MRQSSRWTWYSLGKMPAQFKLSRRQIIALAGGLAVVLVASGIFLGFIPVPWRTPSTSSNPSSTLMNGQTVSETGTIRRLEAPENHSNFYLEKADKSQILLESASIDPSFFSVYVGETLTVEGTVGRTADGKQEILSVQKVVIK